MTPEGSIIARPDRPVQIYSPIEAVVACVVAAAVSATLAAFTMPSPIGIIALLVALGSGIAAAYHVRGSIVILLLCTWARKNKKFAIVVTSDSPKWNKRIALDWMPAFDAHAVQLNWSQHSAWHQDLPSLAFHLLVGPELHPGRREYCPVVMVPTGWASLRVYRFFRAFREARKDHGDLLESLEESMKRDYAQWTGKETNR